MLHTAHTLTAYFQAKPGQEDALRNALTTLVLASRAEPGCLFYTLHESNEEKGTFFIYEAWVNKAAHETHRQTPHLEHFRKQRDSLVETASVKPWQSLKIRETSFA